ncbi:MAG TPA: hypothetical protein VGK88_00510 [bacterium]|jgi:hypothetical protein
MKYLWMFLAIAILAAPVAPAAGQTVHTVAVIDFVDETSDGAMIGAPRLSAELSRELASASAGRLRVVPVETVRAAMAARGFGTREIFNTTKLMEIAAAVGADWIVTGRWMHLDTDWITIERPGSDSPQFRYLMGDAMIEVRVIEAPSRKVILADSFSDTVQGFFGPQLVMLQAALRVLRQVAVTIARTAP